MMRYDADINIIEDKISLSLEADTLCSVLLTGYSGLTLENRSSNVPCTRMYWETSKVINSSCGLHHWCTRVVIGPQNTRKLELSLNEDNGIMEIHGERPEGIRSQGYCWEFRKSGNDILWWPYET